MLREAHNAVVAMVAKASLLLTQPQCWRRYGWQQTLLVTETQGTTDSLLRLADDSMVGRKGAGRGQVGDEHLIPANSRASVQHAGPKPEHRHLAQHREGKSALQSGEQ